MDYLAIAVAGFIGAILRNFIQDTFQALVHPLPFGTLFINVSGSFLLGLFLKLTTDGLKINPNLRIAIGTGLLGAYTTFSTFSVESVSLIREGNLEFALVYILGTPLGCLLAAWAGLSVANKFKDTHDKRSEG